MSCFLVLTWISIYWFSKAGPTASTRIYFEVIKQNPLAFSTDLATPIPTGYSYFPKEIAVLPRRYVISTLLSHATSDP